MDFDAGAHAREEGRIETSEEGVGVLNERETADAVNRLRLEDGGKELAFSMYLFPDVRRSRSRDRKGYK